MPTRLPNRTAEQAVASFEETLRKNISRNDQVLVIEPLIFAVLAVTGDGHVEAVRERLKEIWVHWAQNVVGTQVVPPVRLAAVTHPQDGELPAALLQQAKDKLDASRTKPT